MSFIGLLQQFVATAAGVPYYVRGKNGGRLLQAAALTLDSFTEEMMQGLRLGYPLSCHSSALPSIAYDRRIRLYPTEPIDSQRSRLAQWKSLHRRRGTHRGELQNLATYFSPAKPLMRVVHQDGAGGRATWHSLSEDGAYAIAKRTPTNWDFDGVTAKWSRWWCIIYRDPLMNWLDASTYDDGTIYGDGTLWDGGPSTDQIGDIVEALKEAQGAHSMLWGVIIANNSASFDPESVSVTDSDGWTSLPVGNWGSTIDNTTGLPTRRPDATFIYDLGKG